MLSLILFIILFCQFTVLTYLFILFAHLFTAGKQNPNAILNLQKYMSSTLKIETAEGYWWYIRYLFFSQLSKKVNSGLRWVMELKLWLQ